jgi:hypothetical protein
MSSSGPLSAAGNYAKPLHIANWNVFMYMTLWSHAHVRFTAQSLNFLLILSNCRVIWRFDLEESTFGQLGTSGEGHGPLRPMTTRRGVI